jgi:cyclic pyranopterin phosphate synthase
MKWTSEAEAAIKKVPFFVRKKVRARVEREAAAEGKAVVTIAEMLGRLAPLLRVEQARAYPEGRGPAGYLEARDGSGRRVGFIGAMTDNFCRRCNRVRVTARGEIRACLAAPDGLSLRDLMRGGADDEALLHRISASTGTKRSGHGFDVAGVDRHQAVQMSRIGG